MDKKHYVMGRYYEVVCCREHPMVRKCSSDIDDNTDKDRKYWKFALKGVKQEVFVNFLEINIDGITIVRVDNHCIQKL